MASSCIGRKRCLYGAILLLLFFALFEGASYVALERFLDPSYRAARLRLLGHENAAQGGADQRAVGQAYLLYIPAPGYTESSANYQGEWHNKHGYRGKAVPLDRREGYLRLLFLGGSTTYGWAVEDPDETYPAQLGRLLEGKLPPGYSGVEVINAGLPHGTTAELLTHYHFKFHYYRPDIVVIQTGGNDAVAAAFPHYQPDYSHWRQPMLDLPALRPGLRWVARSRLVSLILLESFYPALLPGRRHVRSRPAPPLAPWYRDARPTENDTEIPGNELAFRHNLDALLAMCRADGAKVVLVPFRPAPGDQYPAKVLRGMVRNEAVLRNAAKRHSTGWAAFPKSVISPQNWTDKCHLNAAGNREKAHHILAAVLEQIALPRKGAFKAKEDQP